jgi:hypothetical protein
MAALRLVCMVCLLGSVVLVAGVFGWDIAHGLRPLAVHQRGTAIALILIGASYALAHMQSGMRVGPRIRAISLGSAFVLWGVEQFMPAGRLAIAVDCALVAIFVVDLGLAVKKRLSREDS